MLEQSDEVRTGVDRQPSRSLSEFETTWVAEVPPHVRDTFHLDQAMRRMLLALIPCLGIGLYNTGYQANLALARLGLDQPPGWRGKILSGLQLASDPGSFTGCLFHGMLYGLPLFVVSLCLAWFWEYLFAACRGRPTTDSFLLTGMLFTLLLPPGAPLWQVALGISFGVVLGQEVFGGIGKNFLNPALVGLVFLHLAYSGSLAGDPLWPGIAGYAGTSFFAGLQATGSSVFEESGITLGGSLLGLVPGPLGATSPLAAGLGAALLLRCGLVSWRPMAGVVLGLAGSLLFLRLALSNPGPVLSLSWSWHLGLGSLAFGMAFLVTDPASSAITDSGRWVFGALIGFMVVLIRSRNPLHPDGVILAVLLGSVFAPLIDSLFIWLNVRRRRNVLQSRFRAVPGSPGAAQR